jgi:hypothetical protein
MSVCDDRLVCAHTVVHAGDVHTATVSLVNELRTHSSLVQFDLCNDTVELPDGQLVSI